MNIFECEHRGYISVWLLGEMQNTVLLNRCRIRLVEGSKDSANMKPVHIQYLEVSINLEKRGIYFGRTSKHFRLNLLPLLLALSSLVPTRFSQESTYLQRVSRFESGFLHIRRLTVVPSFSSIPTYIQVSSFQVAVSDNSGVQLLSSYPKEEKPSL